MNEPSLEQVLADMRGEAAVLRRAGNVGQADYLERFADAVQHAAHEFLTWCSEQEAMLRSGRSKAWLRSQFPDWFAVGNARKKGKEREYRMLILPKRANVSAAREAGRHAGRTAA